MAKSGIAILFLLLIQAQVFNRAWIWLSFSLNQESIARTLCVKREIQNNTCRGKCYLKKQLKASDDKESFPASNHKKGIIETEFAFIRTYPPRLVFIVVEPKQTFHDRSTQWVKNAFERGLFRPPQVV